MRVVKTSLFVLAVVCAGLLVYVASMRANSQVVTAGANEQEYLLELPDYSDDQVMFSGTYPIMDLSSGVIAEQIDDATLYVYKENDELKVLLLAAPFQGETSMDAPWEPEGSPEISIQETVIP